MEEKMSTKKTRGAWVVTVRGEEKKDVSKQSSNHQNRPEGGKLRGGAR